MNELTTLRGVVLYVGALLGPSVLLLPGLAAAVAGPASLVAWSGLLVVSGLLAWMFSALGVRMPSGGGAAGYIGAAFGRRAERAAAAIFVCGVVAGAPVVCLIGGGYVSAAAGGRRAMTIVVAAALLVTVVVVTCSGARASLTAQLVLVGALVALVLVAVLGAAPHAHPTNLTPFAPHGWSAVGSAAALLMLSFVGWEAIAPLIGRLGNPAAQLPRVIGMSFAITSAIYLALAATTVAVLGRRADTHAPVAALLSVAVGRVGPAAAAVAAVALTLAAVNAYLGGASEMVASMRAAAGSQSTPPTGAQRQWPGNSWARVMGLPLGVGIAGLIALGAVGAGVVSVTQLVALPTVLFLAVYVGCTLAAVRLLRGPVRAGASVAAIVVTIIAGFSGWGLLVPVVVGSLAAGRRPRTKFVVTPCSEDGIRC